MTRDFIHALPAMAKSWLLFLFRFLIRFSSFKGGVLMVAICLFACFRRGDRLRDVLNSLDHRFIDLMFRARGAQPATGSVIIVDIDEKSLKELDQFPWPRDKVAELLLKIAEGEPKVIGLDIVFAEPDRTSLKNFLPRIKEALDVELNFSEEELDNDIVLGNVIADHDIVLGYFFEFKNDGMFDENVRPCPEPLALGDVTRADVEALEIPLAYRPVLNNEKVGMAPLSEGFFNSLPDADGTVRRTPLFMHYIDAFYPSLTVEMLCEGLAEGGERLYPTLIWPDVASLKGIRLLLHQIYVAFAREAVTGGLLGVKLGDRMIFTDRSAAMWLNFRGFRQKQFKYVSAVDALTGSLPPDVFRDKYVLLGTSATGLVDQRATPFSVDCPGVEVNATVIDNVLAGDSMGHLEELDTWVSAGVIAIGGLLLAALLAYGGPVLGAIGAIVSLALVIQGNYHFFFLNNLIVGITLPLASLLLVFMSVTLANYFLEGREKRFIRGAFSHYVSGGVVSELLKDPSKLTLEGEQKVLTVMFSDIRGFTTISEQLDAHTLTVLLNEYLTAMTDIVMARDGTVDKFIGDAIMAIWGAPLPDEDHAENGVTTALEMLTSLETLRAGWVERGLPPIDIGVGVNTGIMSVGNMGSRSRFDYTVIGDNVNLAARLEGLNKEYGTHTLITEATKEATGDTFFCRLVDKVQVKGKTEPVRIYEPLVGGDPDPEVREETERFEGVLDLYFDRNFAEATSLLRKLHEDHPHPLYELYLDRFGTYRETPPPDEWDGAFIFTHK